MSKSAALATLEMNPLEILFFGRGLSSVAWRYKVVRWVRFLMIFMLIVVTATWLFVDLDDLHIRGR